MFKAEGHVQQMVIAKKKKKKKILKKNDKNWFANRKYARVVLKKPVNLRQLSYFLSYLFNWPLTTRMMEFGLS